MNHQYHIKRAHQLYDLNRFEACFKEAKLSLKYNADDATAYHLMILSMIYLERMEEAEAVAKEGLGAMPTSDLLLFSMGVVKLKQDNYVKAKDYIEEAIHLNPLNDLYFLNLAKCYLQFNQIEHADTLLKKCLRLNPNNNHALRLKSQLETHLEGYSDAQSYRTLNKALNLAPENAFNHFVKGNHHWKIRDFENAEYHYHEAMRLDPMNEQARALWMEVRSRKIPFWDKFIFFFPAGSKSILGSFLLLAIFTFPPNLFFLINIETAEISIFSYFLCALTLLLPIIFWVVRPFYKFKMLDQKWSRTSLEISNPSLPIEVLSGVAILSSILLWIFQEEMFFGSWFVSMLLGYILAQERNYATYYPIFKKPLQSSLIVLGVVIGLVALGKYFEEPKKNNQITIEKPTRIVDLSGGRFDISSIRETWKTAAVLKLDNNHLNEIPGTIKEFDDLFFLSLKNNNITHIPRFLFEIKTLRFLDLTGNPIGEKELKKLKENMPEVTLGPMEYVPE